MRRYPMSCEKYDSAPLTNGHIRRVRELLEECEAVLHNKGTDHDASKLKDPEKEMFDEFTPKLKESTYGSEEYKGVLCEMGMALKHHYAHNRHHPEHFENGVNGMTLLDLIEMLSDWKAAGERHADGNMLRSLSVNKTRFAIGDQLFQILMNTITDLGWDK
jgi:hypothetical protein